MRAVCNKVSPARIRHRNLALLQLDGHLLGGRIAAGSRRVDRHLGDLEVLQVHTIGGHPCCSQRALHDVHERTWPADVVLGSIGVLCARNECVDVRRRHEAALVVEMMV